MPVIHPDESTLRRFMRGGCEPAETRQVVAHLLSDCPECRAITSREWSEPISGSASASSSDSVDFRPHENDIARERGDAPTLWEKLEGLPHARRKVVVRNSRRYQTWSLCELLLERAFELGFHDPAEALLLTELAVDVADHLDPLRYGEELVCDFRARAIGYRANALRINSEYKAAGPLLSQAFELLQDGTGDILEDATLQKWLASLRNDEGDIKEAIRVQRRVIRLYRRAGEDQLEGRALMNLGAYFGKDDRPLHAVEVLRRALERLDPSETRWIVACRHNLALNLKRSGQLVEALELLKETRSLYAQVGDRMILLRLSDLEGQLARELGHYAAAERSLSAACNGFIELGVPFEAAFVALELADLFLEQGRTREVREVTGRLYRTFEALEASAAAVAAVALFQEAVTRDALTGSVIADVRDRLARASSGSAE